MADQNPTLVTLYQSLCAQQDAISKAIQDAQWFGSNLWSGINKDDKIGSVVYTFSQQDIVQRRYTINLNRRWQNEGDWEMFGVISAPDPVSARERRLTSRRPG